METHKIYTGMAGWLLLIGLSIYAWTISSPSSPAVSLSPSITKTYPVIPENWLQSQFVPLKIDLLEKYSGKMLVTAQHTTPTTIGLQPE